MSALSSSFSPHHLHGTPHGIPHGTPHALFGSNPAGGSIGSLGRHLRNIIDRLNAAMYQLKAANAAVEMCEKASKISSEAFAVINCKPVPPGEWTVAIVQTLVSKIKFTTFDPSVIAERFRPDSVFEI
jgi:hypothetical protein